MDLGWMPRLKKSSMVTDQVLPPFHLLKPPCHKPQTAILLQNCIGNDHVHAGLCMSFGSSFPLLFSTCSRCCYGLGPGPWPSKITPGRTPRQRNPDRTGDGQQPGDGDQSLLGFGIVGDTPIPWWKLILNGA